MSRSPLQRTGTSLRQSSLVTAVILLLPAIPASAAEPLHTRIDRLIEQGTTGPVAKQCTDAEFLRRACLDLHGTIPSSTAARAFLNDASPDKRARLIDRLLAAPHYARYMSNVFDVLLMERRRDKHVKSDQWEPYLHASFAENKPYDQLVREILSADGVDPEQRAKAKFYLEREAEPNLLTRDTGRILFGMDLQCAQCHNHPLVDSYLQEDYYGLFAFFNRSFLFTDKKAKKSFLAEKAEGAVTFTSVFTGDGGTSRPRLPDGTELIEPVPVPGEEYKVEPADNVRPVPKYSRREKLAEMIAAGNSRVFNRNIANRLWGHMLGRGLVHPVDFLHPDNPPSHPELLELLAGEFAAHGYDIKWFLREIALSKTYQRSIDVPEEVQDEAAVLAEQLPQREAELKKLQQAAEEARRAWEAGYSELEPLRKTADEAEEKLAKARTAVKEAEKAHEKPAKELNQARQQLAAKQSTAKVVGEASAKAQEAVKLLPEEKEIASAAATLKARAEKLNAEVEALKKTVAQKEEAAKPTAEKLTAAKKAAEEIIPTVLTAQKAMKPVQETISSRRTEYNKALMRANAAGEQLDEIRSLVEYRILLKERKSASERLASAASRLEGEQKSLAENEASLKSGRDELVRARQRVTKTTASLESARKALAEHQSRSKLVTQAAVKVKQAAAAIPDDSKLAQATRQISIRADELAQRVGSLEKQAKAEEEAVKAAERRVGEVEKAVATTEAAIEQAQSEVRSLNSEVRQLQAEVESTQAAADEASGRLAGEWSSRFTVARLRPLSPEAMGWSMMQATGLTDRQRAAERAALQKKDPKAWEARDETERAAAVEAAVYEKLKGNVQAFVNLFGAGAGQPQHEFFATVDQALFLSNAGTVRGWLNPGGGNLTDRLVKTADARPVAEEMYLSVLTRRPTEQEIAEVEKYLTGREKDRTAALQELCWALLTSSEFRFNH